ncbi:hypothetical protein GTZ99_09595 [Novosphingobium sp. FSY-8]|uniref:Sporulation related protein n=1 Tax=Novosphingobium ovatum TaxID=1908523 RepID=A0ABW9XE42_9SPHN|nr:SPOR domain-containing protein [Novosphingobium ovatum]NBC36809.1 hypothetical protein [Novosphingobium ovatum]
MSGDGGEEGLGDGVVNRLKSRARATMNDLGAGDMAGQVDAAFDHAASTAGHWGDSAGVWIEDHDPTGFVRDSGLTHGGDVAQQAHALFGAASAQAGDGVDHLMDQGSAAFSGAVAGVTGAVEEPLAALGARAQDAMTQDDQALELNERDHLPWLESDDDGQYEGVDTKRVIGLAAGGLGLLGAIVGGIFWLTHRTPADAPAADGSVVVAPSDPVKVAPSDAGGKTFAGTGDTSFADSQGRSAPMDVPHAAAAGAAAAAASVAAAEGGAVIGTTGGVTKVAPPAPVAAAPVAAPAAPAAAAVAGPAGGVVQIAAYSSRALAQAGWDRLSGQHAMLKGMNHRIVEAKIDLGTVYRLQLVTNAGGGAALCSRLRGEGLPCQVKN